MWTAFHCKYLSPYDKTSWFCWIIFTIWYIIQKLTVLLLLTQLEILFQDFWTTCTRILFTERIFYYQVQDYYIFSSIHHSSLFPSWLQYALEMEFLSFKARLPSSWFRWRNFTGHQDRTRWILITSTSAILLYIFYSWKYFMFRKTKIIHY